MVHEEDLETVIEELKAKLRTLENPGLSLYASGMLIGLELSIRRLRWLKEGRYERARLEKEKP